MVKERIKDNEGAARLIEQAQERLGDDALKNALAAFYLQPGKGDKGGSVEFAHKSFSEFLFAQSLKESLEEWTVPGRRGEEFLVNNAQMAWEIYDLLGYGGLSQEIVEYLMDLLDASDEFNPVQLFKRLENFYLRWCDGEFIDALQHNYPQKKMSQLQEEEIELGVRQVDIHAGLNVMILLFQLHYYAQSRDYLKGKIAFYPCGNKGHEGFDEYRLLRIYNYSKCIPNSAFARIAIGATYIVNTNINKLQLGDDAKCQWFINTNIASADFSNVDLSGSYFIGTNLVHIDFSNANLRDAYFIGTTITNADFSNANLRDACFVDVYVLNADFSNANLIDVIYSGANMINESLNEPGTLQMSDEN